MQYYYIISATTNFWATICKTVCPMLSDHCLSSLSRPVCNVGVLWPNGWTDQDETWRADRPRPWPHCVRWRPRSPFPKGAQPIIFGLYLLWLWPISVVAKRDQLIPPQKGDIAPIFGPFLLWPNGCMDQDAT